MADGNGDGRAPHRYTRAELAALPVLAIGQADDLHLEDQPRGTRVWLSRAPPYTVEIECWTLVSGWTTTDSYPTH